MKHQTFNDYLEEQWFKDYHGTKEGAENALDYWMSHLDVQEVIDYAEDWGKIITF